MILGIDASRANRAQKTGVEWYAWHVIQQFKQRIPKDVHVVLYSEKPLAGKLAELPENWESRVLTWPPRRLWTQLRLSWEMLIAPPDVLWIPAHVFPLVRPKKTVMTLHDVAAKRFPGSFNWFERWYSKRTARVALKTLWRVIVPSHFVKDELEGDTSSVSVVHHGYDPAFSVQEVPQAVLERYGITKPYLLFIGRREEKKNTARLVEAFGELDEDLQLVLVGKPGHGYESVQRAIAESKKHTDIIQPGWVAQEDLPQLMNGAAAFVFPTLYEGFGIPVLEALACGTPVVASKGSSLEEVGADACLYADPHSVQDIAAQIKNALAGDENKKQKGLERVQHFSWKKAAKQTAAILLE